MPPTTRSGGNKQAHIDNPKETKAAVTGTKDKAKTSDSSSKKRKTSPSNEKPQKASRKDSPQDDQAEDSNDSILINRAPVLELWAATVTSFMYPALSWETCLSAGSAISTLCAVSKGRAIGTIDQPDPAAAEKKREERRRRAENEELEELEVMGFHLKLKDGFAMVGDKPKKANEATLMKKFGESEYARAKGVFQDALKDWKGKEEDLNAQAFHHYEDFRPTVAQGQKGWGRKGMLNLQAVREAVSTT
ncbi:hypothetical protein WHR41_02901 [Cladosporium halotolerans]|uniref:Uncharacterized protein n=1 Tax=Cladosporium halotolerans TaxID=1052096 RepID=A0AB34KXF4_9PEZI